MKQVKMLLWMCVGATLAAWLLNVRDESLTVINAPVFLTLLLELKKQTARADYPFADLRVTFCCLLSFMDLLLNARIVRSVGGHVGVVVAIFVGMVVLLGVELFCKSTRAPSKEEALWE